MACLFMLQNFEFLFMLHNKACNAMHNQEFLGLEKQCWSVLRSNAGACCKVCWYRCCKHRPGPAMQIY